MFKIRKNDIVLVIAGKDKGRHGKVLAMLPKIGCAVVEGINIVKKHVKANPQKNINGGIVSKTAPIHISNLAIYNQTTKKVDKVIFKLLDNGKKVRCFKSNNELIDV